jgi:ribosomal subunit interface protein
MEGEDKMIQRIDMSGHHTIIDDRLRKYITKKIGGLDRYIPRRGRESAHAEVIMKQAKDADNKQYTCEVTLHLPHEVVNIKEKMSNAFSAVDIAEAKLKQQIGKYKETHATGAISRRLAARSARKLSV